MRLWPVCRSINRRKSKDDTGCWVKPYAVGLQIHHLRSEEIGNIHSTDPNYRGTRHSACYHLDGMKP